MTYNKLIIVAENFDSACRTASRLGTVRNGSLHVLNKNNIGELTNERSLILEGDIFDDSAELRYLLQSKDHIFIKRDQLLDFKNSTLTVIQELSSALNNGVYDNIDYIDAINLFENESKKLSKGVLDYYYRVRNNQYYLYPNDNISRQVLIMHNLM